MDILNVGAVAFDMDGVVIDSAPCIEHAWREAAREHGRPLTDQELRQHVHGSPGLYAVRALFPDHSPQRQQEIWHRVDEYEETAPCDPIQGVVPLLRQLRAAGVAVALVTSSWPERIRFVLAHLDLVGIFTTVVNRTEVPRGKPHPDPYLTAADRMGVACDDLLVFEDSANGIQSALDAKAHCVGVGPAAIGSQGTVAVIPDFTGVQVVLRPNERPLLSGLDIRVVLDEGGERS